MAKLLWSQRQSMGPSARTSNAMAFDSKRQRTVLFGGQQTSGIVGGSLGDTWEWDGRFWIQVADSGPAPRGRHAMAYDENRGRIVLFGGEGEGLVRTLGDTWEWDGEFWIQVSDTGPSGRSLTAMASDTVRKRIVLFGGQGEDGGDIGDTWEWDGNQWTQQDVVGPTARSAHAMAFDPQRGRTVLFGGLIGARPETWEWDGSKWLQVAHIGPEALSLWLSTAGAYCCLGVRQS